MALHPAEANTRLTPHHHDRMPDHHDVRTLGSAAPRGRSTSQPNTRTAQAPAPARQALEGPGPAYALQAVTVQDGATVSPVPGLRHDRGEHLDVLVPGRFRVSTGVQAVVG
jgi:hypothetical protein